MTTTMDTGELVLNVGSGSLSLRLLGVGAPVALDAATKNRTFGFYACVLVDVDLSMPLRKEILMETNDFAFYVGII